MSALSTLQRGRMAKEFNLSLPMTSVQQFAQRFSNDLAAVLEAGFEITINDLRTSVFSVRWHQSGLK
jgi:hypothetical protein